METKYYSCKEKQELTDAFKKVTDLSELNNYDDWNISIDIVGKVNTTPSIYDEEGNIIEKNEPTWTDFLFNVIFVTNRYIDLFKDFKEESPETPFRKFA